MTDIEEEIRNKIMTHAVSGEGEILQDHRMFGANLEKDVASSFVFNLWN